MTFASTSIEVTATAPSAVADAPGPPTAPPTAPPPSAASNAPAPEPIDGPSTAAHGTVVDQPAEAAIDTLIDAADGTIEGLLPEPAAEPETEPAKATQPSAPTAATSEWKDAPERWGPAKDIRKLTDPDLTAKGMSAAAMLLLAFSLLIGFPATLFDGTYRSHYDQIASGLRRRLPRTSALVDVTTRRLPRAPLASMVVFGTLTGAALDPNLGFDGRTFGILGGLAIVVGLAGWLGWWPTKLTSDSYGNDGNYRAYPMGLVVAVLCVMLTRFGNLHPGYLYGLLFAYETRGRWSHRDDGLTFLLGFAVVWAIGLLGWLGLSVWEPAAGPSPSTVAVAADTVLAGLTVAGIEGVVFGMIPFRFAPGRAIWRWSPKAWFALWIPGALSLAVMLSTPDRSLLTVQSEDVSVLRAGLAFLAFSIVSVAFWAYWRRRGTPLPLPSPSELSPLTVAGALDEPATDETAQRDRELSRV